MLYNIYKTVIITIALFISLSAGAQQSCGDGCDCGKTDIAPAGIMNDHVHDKGKWMFSYRYMRMDMQNNIMGSQRISDNDIYTRYNFSMSPDKMNMDMHMLMAMYGVSDRFTLMAMSSYNTASMTMNMYGGSGMQMPGMSADAVMPNNQSVLGFGDTKLFALYSIVKNDEIQVVSTAGINIPTGSISKPAFNGKYSNYRADYNMQPGSGTLDFLPGISFLLHYEAFDFGAQLCGAIRPFNNLNGWHYGHQGMAEIWAAKKWNEWLSNSIRIEAIADGSITGLDAAIYSLMDPAANALNYGGFKAIIYPGINFYPGTFLSTDIKLRLEYGIPVYQYAQGIQMANKSTIIANLDFIF